MATYSASELTNAEATPPTAINPLDWMPGKYVIRWSHTQAGSALVAGDTLRLCKLPGNCKVILDESYVKISATQGASTTADIGWAAYTKTDGTTQAADVDGLIDGWDATTTAKEAWVTSGTHGATVDVMSMLEFDSQEDVVITWTPLDSGGTYDGDIGDTYDGYFTVVVPK